MAKAVINLQKESGGIVKISPVDGTGVTEVIVPESGELATKEYVDNGAGAAFVSNDNRVKTALNATGDAPIYACRAWVNFDGTTNPPTIRASGNVSSIVKNTTGSYTVNFAVALPSTNYVVSGSAYGVTNISYNSYVAGDNKATTSCPITVPRINGSNAGPAYDSPNVSVAFIGG